MDAMITIEAIQLAVAQRFNLSLIDFRSDSRKRGVAIPRQTAMYLAKQMTDESLSGIGREFGGKHPTTVMHSIARIHHLRTVDGEMNKAVEAVLEALYRSTNPGITPKLAAQL